MKALVLLIFGSLGMTAKAQQPYWQQQVNYYISVTLNDQENTLDGSEKIEYYNNSEDTLRFLWVHVWPNAYKNDRTAFTEQMLSQGNTKFYFSNEEDKGYINRLMFTVNGTIAVMENHPKHQDIIRLLLPSPLPPHQHAVIETPFHVKLPYNISRGGHIGQSYQITQWYPKVALYDVNGWHEMPYLDQGEFYNDFGKYIVSITLPANYRVAATGEMIRQTSFVEANPVSAAPATVPAKKNTKTPVKKNISETVTIPSSPQLRTVVYEQENVTDFAWFADKRFIVEKDTVQLPSGKTVDVAAYYLPGKEKEKYWTNAIQFTKKTILQRSILVGEYPYNTVSVVQGDLPYGGGMEYPGITILSGVKSNAALESIIEHEVGHNWFQAILATDERQHPWMDEGMNSYYRYRHLFEQPADASTKNKTTFLQERMPADSRNFNMRLLAAEKRDQPVETGSEEFSAVNYGLGAYYKASLWMQQLEQYLGTAIFDSCMRQYYQQWKFKHPSPQDFIHSFEKTGGKDLSLLFSLLHQKDSDQPAPAKLTLTNETIKRKVRLASFFSFKKTDKYKYVFLSPAAGFNMYDKLMVGVLLHKYTLPEEKIQFLMAPLYATGSRQLNGVAKLNYHWYNKQSNRIELGVNASHFSSKFSLDSSNSKVFENFTRVVPYLQFHLRKEPRSTLSRWFDWRTYIINEKYFDSFDTVFRPTAQQTSTRYINQLTFTAENTRVLYPYSYQLQIQQGNGFVRANATGNYFFNYGKNGGMQVRVFTAAFRFTGPSKTEGYSYMPKLMAANGVDDYTYSSYFLGRTASVSNGETPVKNAGVAAQQIMVQNSGGLKLRPDLFSSIQGYSEKWVAAVNLNTTLPENLFPVKIPLKLYFDIGTYAEAWDKERKAPKFLYTGGLQLSLFKNALNVYAPLIYSSAIKNELKTDPVNNTFGKRITFSIDVHNLTIKKVFPQFAL